MTHMDYAIGEVIQTLKDEKLLDNTIVIFISDNGGQENWYPEKRQILNCMMENLAHIRN